MKGISLLCQRLILNGVIKEKKWVLNERIFGFSEQSPSVSLKEKPFHQRSCLFIMNFATGLSRKGLPLGIVGISTNKTS